MKEANLEWVDYIWKPLQKHTAYKKVCSHCDNTQACKEVDCQGESIIRAHEAIFLKPLKFKTPSVFFLAASLDFFHPDADGYRDEIWDIISATPQHTYLILTKKPERIKDHLPSDWHEAGYGNVWLGTVVEDQWAAERVEVLNELKTKDAAFKTWIAAEPLKGKIDFNGSLLRLDWMVIGGDACSFSSKRKLSDCQVEWILYLIDQCRKSNTPYYIKQLGNYLARKFDLKSREGRDINEFPYHFLKVRDLPG